MHNYHEAHDEHEVSSIREFVPGPKSSTVSIVRRKFDGNLAIEPMIPGFDLEMRFVFSLINHSASVLLDEM